MVRVLGSMPSTEELLDILDATAEVLGVTVCWAYDGRYHFPIGDGWTIAISAESAGRVRVETCRLTAPVHTMWAFARDGGRLASLVERMSQRIVEVA